ncbi:O-antigen ligase family protein [Cognatitamlana onchidii]|uniref:O-antigen ligase family protein n=1 Tax=Cognatitamlana onchidii TaxID=2562860 RepID=UPI001F311A95|nr:O-antigen ligase family protein [Algibacter onchidii]
MIIFLNRDLGKIYFILALLFFLRKIIVTPKREKSLIVLKGCAYFVGAEVFFRMTKSALSYEVCKYIVILFTLLGIYYKGASGRSYPYFIYLFCLVPAIFVASMTLSFEANFRKNILFVLSGPICLGMASVFCYNRTVSRKQLDDVLLYVLLPLISLTTYVFLYNPSVKDVLSGTSSNAATSGGFGANQVSTALGLGMFLLGARLISGSSKLGIKVLNIILFVAISFRAVVTFSRGGVLVGLLCLTFFLLSYFVNAPIRIKGVILRRVMFFLSVMVVTWVISSNQTMGLIDKRYANENALGEEKKDVTTGRFTLFMDEIEGFVKNPILGVGASRTKDKRIEEQGDGLPTHNEVSRLLAEHGFLGIVILLILVFAPLAYRTQNTKNYYFYAFLCFWFATINHSSMRIAAPAFIYALSLLNITHDKPTIHRKQAIAKR